MSNHRQQQRHLPVESPEKLYAVIRPLIEVHPETADHELSDTHPLWNLEELARVKQERQGFPPHVPVIGFRATRKMRDKGFSAAHAMELLEDLEFAETQSGTVQYAETAGRPDNPQALKIFRLRINFGLIERTRKEAEGLLIPSLGSAAIRQHFALHISQGRDAAFCERMERLYNREPINGARIVVGGLTMVDGEYRTIARPQPTAGIAS